MVNIRLIRIIIVVTVVIINNPYIMACLFAQVLFLVSLSIGLQRKFVGFIMFLVYIGGLLIIISYCVMLLPNKKNNNPLSWTPFALIALTVPISYITKSSSAFGLSYSASIVLLTSLLLFLVLLAVVAIIDFSRGIMKVYGKYATLWGGSSNFMSIICIINWDWL